MSRHSDRSDLRAILPCRLESKEGGGKRDASTFSKTESYLDDMKARSREDRKSQAHSETDQVSQRGFFCLQQGVV